MVHLGQGEWMIVDSCARKNFQPALSYLRAIGVEPENAVKLVVATHWHDDHVRGIAQVLTVCREAFFVCSGAMESDEIFDGIAALPPEGRGLASGVKEMREVLELLARGDRPWPQARYAIQDRLLYRRTVGIKCEVLAASPRDEAVQEALTEIATLITMGGRDRVRRPERNDGAVALWVEVGGVTMLLGSDLQEDPGGGWTAIVKAHGGTGRRAEIFKVPHHGSSNGHLEQVWKKLLRRRPHAVLCPHCNGRNIIPTDADLKRICERSTKVHITSHRDRGLRMLGGHLMRPKFDGFGSVTLRRGLGGRARWKVYYDGLAGECCGPQP